MYNNPKISASSTSRSNAEACVVEMQDLSIEQSTDRPTIETPKGLEDVVQSVKVICEDAAQAKILPSSTPLSSSGQTPTVKTTEKTIQACELIKPLTHCGSVCTTSPRATKVESVAANSAKTYRAVHSLLASTDTSEAGPSNSHSNLEKSSKNSVRSTPSGSCKDVDYFSPEVAPSTSQPVSDGALAEGVCSSTTDHVQHTAEKNVSGAYKRQLVQINRQAGHVHYKVPCELYSSVVLDPEEIKRQERINRLKDLLKQKEAELEKLRKSM